MLFGIYIAELDILEFSAEGALGEGMSGSVDVVSHDFGAHSLESLELSLDFLLSECSIIFLI